MTFYCDHLNLGPSLFFFLFCFFAGSVRGLKLLTQIQLSWKSGGGGHLGESIQERTKWKTAFKKFELI